MAEPAEDLVVAVLVEGEEVRFLGDDGGGLALLSGDEGYFSEALAGFESRDLVVVLDDFIVLEALVLGVGIDFGDVDFVLGVFSLQLDDIFFLVFSAFFVEIFLVSAALDVVLFEALELGVDSLDFAFDFLVDLSIEGDFGRLQERGVLGRASLFGLAGDLLRVICFLVVELLFLFVGEFDGLHIYLRLVEVYLTL